MRLMWLPYSKNIEVLVARSCLNKIILDTSGVNHQYWRRARGGCVDMVGEDCLNYLGVNHQ